MKKNTLKQVKDLLVSLDRVDLKVKQKYPKEPRVDDYYVIISETESKRYEVTFSKTSGFLSIRTFEGSRIVWDDVEMILSLDKVLKRMRNEND